MKRAVLIGGLVGGAFDITFACVNAAAHGVHWARVGNFVASGLLGSRAFEHGAPVAALGFALHFAIALGWALLYNVASRSFPILLRRPLIAGPLYGALIYAMMNLVVLPLSAVPHTSPTWTARLIDLSVHMFLLAPSIALAAARRRLRPRA
jgi:uncharacterized membrane protein YagU involved in acid resistance